MRLITIREKISLNHNFKSQWCVSALSSSSSSPLPFSHFPHLLTIFFFPGSEGCVGLRLTRFSARIFFRRGNQVPSGCFWKLRAEKRWISPFRSLARSLLHNSSSNLRVFPLARQGKGEIFVSSCANCEVFALINRADKRLQGNVVRPHPPHRRPARPVRGFIMCFSVCYLFDVSLLNELYWHFFFEGDSAVGRHRERSLRKCLLRSLRAAFPTAAIVFVWFLSKQAAPLSVHVKIFRRRRRLLLNGNLISQIKGKSLRLSFAPFPSVACSVSRVNRENSAFSVIFAGEMTSRGCPRARFLFILLMKY